MPDYRLTQKGREAGAKQSQAGQVLNFMREAHPVVNPAEVAYEFSIPEQEAKATLDSLTKARMLERVDEGRIL